MSCECQNVGTPSQRALSKAQLMKAFEESMSFATGSEEAQIMFVFLKLGEWAEVEGLLSSGV